MAVYVDDYRILWRGREWSHLIADSTEELHGFAARLGRAELRFHHKPARPWKDHYDVPETKRAQAIRLGAKPITPREAAQMLRARRLVLRDGAGADATTIVAMRGSAGAPEDLTREELARQAARSWTDAQSLLFVCLGNVCRSPFAERLALNRFQGRRQATSAGSYPSSGRRPPGLALAAAEPFGVDLASHRSRVLSSAMIEEADAVFVFDDENYETVASRHPGAAGRTHLLGSLSPHGQLVVDDPFCGPASAYEAAYRQIAAAIEAAEQARR
ncbi:MAG: DUF4031 domain-containing protein [Solirubrobacteraceae bacterium]